MYAGLLNTCLLFRLYTSRGVGGSGGKKEGKNMVMRRVFTESNQSKRLINECSKWQKCDGEHFETRFHENNSRFVFLVSFRF